jgi:hypothetical protein
MDYTTSIAARGATAILVVEANAIVRTKPFTLDALEQRIAEVLTAASEVRGLI